MSFDNSVMCSLFALVHRVRLPRRARTHFVMICVFYDGENDVRGTNMMRSCFTLPPPPPPLFLELYFHSFRTEISLCSLFSSSFCHFALDLTLLEFIYPSNYSIMMLSLLLISDNLAFHSSILPLIPFWSVFSWSLILRDHELLFLFLSSLPILHLPPKLLIFPSFPPSLPSFLPPSLSRSLSSSTLLPLPPPLPVSLLPFSLSPSL